MTPLLHRLNGNPHPFEPATWPKAVVLVGYLLVLIWLSLGLRMLWAHAPSGHSRAFAVAEKTCISTGAKARPANDKLTNPPRPAIDTNSQTRIIPRP